jgi:hypothetical protein
VPEPRSLWERIQLSRATREPRKWWQRVAEWDTVLEIAFIIAIAIYVCATALFRR